MFLSVFIACLFLGAVVGFLAGLLGIGGGLIIVPALVYLLPLLNINTEVIMPIALATSLASIVVTSASAAYAHHQRDNIPWDIARKLMAFIAIGALLGAFVASMLSAKSLTTFFAGGVIALAVYMLIATRSTRERAMMSNLALSFLGLFTGVIASLMGIAGGIILVPTLSYFGLSMRYSIGVATACGLMVAIFGSIGYIISGWGQTLIPEWSLGYIYLPALLGIITSSSIFAHTGVKYASKLPVASLKKFFAIFLIVVAIKMIFQ